MQTNGSVSVSSLNSHLPALFTETLSPLTYLGSWGKEVIRRMTNSEKSFGIRIINIYYSQHMNKREIKDK